MNIEEKIIESNRIEGINRPPRKAEIEEFKRFIRLDVITIEELERFVGVYQPGAKLRSRPGDDCRVGSHHPIGGGPELLLVLTELLTEIENKTIHPFHAHITYETIHPFMDCNGRSGRMLWYWMMAQRWGAVSTDIGFLHRFYYQTLHAIQK